MPHGNTYGTNLFLINPLLQKVSDNILVFFVTFFLMMFSNINTNVFEKISIKAIIIKPRYSEKYCLATISLTIL